MSRLLISFSGGETSALMTKLCRERLRYDEVMTVFANTGEEREETLRFVQQCDEAFGFGVRWVEAVISPERGVGIRAKEVTFETASRNGEPFEAMIAKYGIPNRSRPLCTKYLKERAIDAFARDQGWAAGSYDVAIGIRADEIDRISPNAQARRLIYPLIKLWPHRKVDVNEFWFKQPFRLGLKSYQGNCKWCWKKTLRKHLTLLNETPEIYDFPERMELLYPHAGPQPDGEPHVFFREGRSTKDMRRLAATLDFEPAHDEARDYQIDLFSALALDLPGGCEESCEVTFDSEDDE